MTADLTLGVDLGTTVAKAAVFSVDDSRTPLAVAELPSPTLVPRPGWSESSMDVVREVCFSAIRTVIAGIDPHRIGAIGVSGTACGAWLVDVDGRPVRDAILWNDGRAAEVTAAWVEDGTLAEIFAIGGNVPYPGYTLPLLGWLRRNEPASLDLATNVLTSKDWIRSCLTGEIGTDVSDASYAPFDVANRRWSAELSELCGVTPGDHGLLPVIREDTHTAPLLPDVASMLGLVAGTPVAMGLTDIIAGTLGAGAVEPASAVSVIGTSAVSTVLMDTPELAPAGVGLTAAAPLGLWGRTMVNTAGGMTLDWVVDSMGFDGVSDLVAAAEQAREANGLVLLPYLSGAGVVSPFASPNAHGAMAGFRAGHTRADIARAAVEGVAFAIAESYHSMAEPVSLIVAAGGGSRSDLLLQTLADAAGVVVQRSSVSSPGARSVALLAARSAGLIDSDDAVRAALAGVDTGEEFTPRERPTNYDLYRALSDTTRPLWPTWNQTRRAGA